MAFLSKKEKKDDNFLDYIPVKNPENTWSERKDGRMTIHMVHKGFFNKIAQVVFFTPEVSHVDLDEYGTFIWKAIDGEKTVGDLADILEAEYGEAAHPLYERLIQYMRILKNNKFIIYRKKESEEIK